MPRPDAVPGDALPGRADVVVIGAGVAGISTALELAERGLSVVVCDKGVVAGEQSSRNWGWVRQMGRDPRELPLMRVSIGLWRQMRQRTGAETGFRECGIAYLCRNERQMERRRRWHADHAGTHGLRTRVLSASEAQALTPGATIRWTGGLLTPDDARAEPTLAVPAMARAAQRRGARIVQRCAVRTLERSGGRVRGVVTEKGPVATERVVLAGGAWSRHFAFNEGVDLPQLAVVNSVLRTAPFEAPIAHSLAGAGFAIRRRLDGGWTVAHSDINVADLVPDSFRLLSDFRHLAGEFRDYRLRLGPRFAREARMPRRWTADEQSPFEGERVRDPTHVPRVLDAAWRNLRTALPVFEQARVAERWAGAIDVTPDAVPMIGPIARVPGLFVLTGLSGHGFGLGPGAGRLLAQMMEGEAACVDPTPFRPERFRRMR